MKTILISGEPCVIEGFLHEAGNVEELEVLRTFQEENEALDMVSRQEVDLAVIDLEMQKVNQDNGSDIVNKSCITIKVCNSSALHLLHS